MDFRALRFDTAHHLGMGDIRLTIGQQEEIDAEISALRTDKESLMVGRDFLMAEIEKLKDELAECRKDADRYKWLRFPRLHWDVLHQRDEDSVWLDMHGNDLDIAIDAAILLDKR